MITRFKEGDRVRIVRNIHAGIIEDDGYKYDYFNQYIGTETMLTKFNQVNEDDIVCWYTDIVIDDPISVDKFLSVCEGDIELI